MSDICNSCAVHEALRSADFVGDGLDAGGDDVVGLGVADADALARVAPGPGQAGEEMLAGNYEDMPLFQALVELLVRDGQLGKP